MPPRSYDMSRRAEQVAETRESILDAARELFLAEGFHGVSVDDIAAAADVARATVYHHFGTKSELLEAVLETTMLRAGYQRLSGARDPADPLETFFEGIREICRFWHAEQTVFRNLMGLAAVDADARRIVREHEAKWREGIAELIHDLRARGFLKETLSEDEALAILYMIFSFQGYDLLSMRGQLTPGEVERIMRRIVERLLEVDD